jgi:hypothetical protein
LTSFSLLSLRVSMPSPIPESCLSDHFVLFGNLVAVGEKQCDRLSWSRSEPEDSISKTGAAWPVTLPIELVSIGQLNRSVRPSHDDRKTLTAMNLSLMSLDSGMDSLNSRDLPDPHTPGIRLSEGIALAVRSRKSILIPMRRDIDRGLERLIGFSPLNDKGQQVPTGRRGEPFQVATEHISAILVYGTWQRTTSARLLSDRSGTYLSRFLVTLFTSNLVRFICLGAQGGCV